MMPVAIPDESRWLNQCTGLREVTRKRWGRLARALGRRAVCAWGLCAAAVHLPELDPGMGAAVNPLGLN